MLPARCSSLPAAWHRLPLLLLLLLLLLLPWKLDGEQEGVGRRAAGAHVDQSIGAPEAKEVALAELHLLACKAAGVRR